LVSLRSLPCAFLLSSGSRSLQPHIANEPAGRTEIPGCSKLRVGGGGILEPPPRLRRDDRPIPPAARARGSF